jgi:RNA polymerase sigma-70 factor (ECF subfamily)
LTYKTPESKLITQAQKGDKKAVSRLVNKYSPRIYAIAFRLMQNQEDAEDVLQETFIIMLNKLDTFQGKSSLYTWLYRVATNVALGKLRKKKNIDNSMTSDNVEFENISSLELADWPDHLEEKFDAVGFRNCLDKAIEQLPDHYRAVFILRDLEGHSTRNTAEILDISEANVKVRLMRARLYLRDQMAYHLKCIDRGDNGR